MDLKAYKISAYIRKHANFPFNYLKEKEKFEIQYASFRSLKIFLNLF